MEAELLYLAMHEILCNYAELGCERKEQFEISPETIEQELRPVDIEVVNRTLSQPRSTSSLSATNSMYVFMLPQFMPMSATGSASVKNSCSIVTASVMIS